MPKKATTSFLNEPYRRRVLEVYEECGQNKAEAARKLGIPATTFRRHYDEAVRMDSTVAVEFTGVADSRERMEISQSQFSGMITSVSSTRKTPEEAFKASKLDPAIWAIDRSYVSYWDAMTGADQGNEIVTMYQVKVWVSRLVPEEVVDAVDMIMKRMHKFSPKLPPYKRRTPKRRCALEFSPFDCHVGKLAWSKETGDDFDLHIVEHRFRLALEDTLNHWANREVEEIWIPTGGDFLHTDNIENTTTKGTPQDVDGRWHKVYDTACMMLVNAVLRARQVAKVKVIHVPGNHDHERSYYMSRFLYAWFRGMSDVEVVATPHTRTYVEYGSNLIGFAHGSEEPLSKLPLIMPQEQPAAWARTEWHEWHTGDKHHRKKIEIVSIDDKVGVVIRILPSISGVDAWHYRRGYIGAVKAAESYLWGHDVGYLGNYLSTIRTQNLVDK